MKMVSWNARGTNASTKRRGIKSLICKEDPDLMVIRDIKRQEVNRKFVSSIWRSRFKAWALLQVVGRSGGILII